MIEHDLAPAGLARTAQHAFGKLHLESAGLGRECPTAGRRPRRRVGVGGVEDHRALALVPDHALVVDVAQLEIEDLDHVAVTHEVAGHARPVHERAVRAAEVLQDVIVAGHLDRGVLLADRLVLETDARALGAPDDDALALDEPGAERRAGAACHEFRHLSPALLSGPEFRAEPAEEAVRLRLGRALRLAPAVDAHDHHRDVVAPPAIVRHGDERRGSQIEVGCQDLERTGDIAVLDQVVEPVGAQQIHVAREHLMLAEVGHHLLLRAQDTRDELAAARYARLFARHLAGGKLALDERVVRRKAFEPARAPAVDARVPDVCDGHPVALEPRERERRPHPLEGRVGARALQDRAVRGGEGSVRRGARREVLTRDQRLHQGGGGELGREIGALVLRHPVGHGHHAPLGVGDEAVLVEAADPAEVGPRRDVQGEPAHWWITLALRAKDSPLGRPGGLMVGAVRRSTASLYDVDIVGVFVQARARKSPTSPGVSRNVRPGGGSGKKK